MKGPRIVRKKAIDTEKKDPYFGKTGPAELSVCKKCGSVYHGKRWVERDSAPATPSRAVREVVCPACKKITDKYAGGYVTIQGEFIKGHRDEIMNLIRNKEDRARHLNPLERIIEVKDRAEGIEVTTTTEKLAQRIGQMLNKAFSGRVEYKWSSDVKLARVVWTR